MIEVCMRDVISPANGEPFALLLLHTLARIISAHTGLKINEQRTKMRSHPLTPLYLILEAASDRDTLNPRFVISLSSASWAERRSVKFAARKPSSSSLF